MDLVSGQIPAAPGSAHAACCRLEHTCPPAGRGARGLGSAGAAGARPGPRHRGADVGEAARRHLVTFLAAGHETTAKALTWTLYLLARAPRWQDRVLAEVRTVAGSDAIGAEHLDGLTVTRSVLKEAMRLYPPAPVMTRVAASDMELGSKAIRAGTLIVIPIFALHRHRKLWDDPDRFDPDRFAPEREAGYPR